jgi:hypothetical protein
MMIIENTPGFLPVVVESEYSFRFRNYGMPNVSKAVEIERCACVVGFVAPILPFAKFLWPCYYYYTGTSWGHILKKLLGPLIHIHDQLSQFT